MTLDEFTAELKYFGLDDQDKPVVLALIEVAKAAKEADRGGYVTKKLDDALAALDKELEP